MGPFDGAETWELVVCYRLSLLQPKYGNSIGLYRDGGLDKLKGTPQQIERIKKDICKIFKGNELKVTIEANKKIVNFLDVMLELNTGRYMPYMKPGNVLQYVNAQSNHPPVVLENIPVGVNKRLSEISSDEEAFNKAAPACQKALDESGHNYKLKYQQPACNQPEKGKRSRKVIWFNPPYDQNVKTNVGRKFLKIINKCFPPSAKLHKILNKNTVNLLYSCMSNMQVLIEVENKKKLRVENQSTKQCSCRRNVECPLLGECLSKDIVYQATVTSNDKTETCVGLTAATFKSRLANHKASFKSKRNATELSNYIWQLKESNCSYSLNWKILCHASHYSNSTKKCNLCIAEKYFIIFKPKQATLNKKTELISKCRHKDKFLWKIPSETWVRCNELCKIHSPPATDDCRSNRTCTKQSVWQISVFVCNKDFNKVHVSVCCSPPFVYIHTYI